MNNFGWKASTDRYRNPHPAIVGTATLPISINNSRNIKHIVINKQKKSLEILGNNHEHLAFKAALDRKIGKSDTMRRREKQ